MLQLVPFEFVVEMAKVLQAGLVDGRRPNDWQLLDPEFIAQEYRGKLLRHYADGEWPAVAVNAAILWWYEKNANSRKEAPRRLADYVPDDLP